MPEILQSSSGCTHDCSPEPAILTPSNNKYMGKKQSWQQIRVEYVLTIMYLADNFIQKWLILHSRLIFYQFVYSLIIKRMLFALLVLYDLHSSPECDQTPHFSSVPVHPAPVCWEHHSFPQWGRWGSGSALCNWGLSELRDSWIDDKQTLRCLKSVSN